ncbi:S-adenosyl-L-methionine-dependent methyltransferase [Mycena albidolilacea]|uniref:S-adenosyl-L-methionine-dependent methyltransferase n=1 Tax=Mycena albidolilacea TaxID=1033008 RepID=A0AAD7F448_9AGAR|nr:S-adenosyl-L-methionine-dependent methyltransferase [Mycena albidolilacea]
MQRLDKHHLAFTEYLSGKLSPAPLDELRPGRILELGCGSGAWPIQATTQLPAAQILAADRSPLPNRFLPANISFQMADLAKEGDFKPDHFFDIVHARFVFCHVSNTHDAFRRLAQLVRPGGLLLIEDINALSYFETAGPVSRRDHYISMMKQSCDERGADMEFGRKTPDLIRALDDFPDVQVQKMSMPFGVNGPDDALNHLGPATKKFYIGTVDSVAEYLAPRGFTREMALKYREELENDSVDVYCCRARRALASD